MECQQAVLRPPHPRHYIGYLEFPAGPHCDTIVKQFESELYSSPMLSKHAAQRLTCPKQFTTEGCED